MQHGLLEQVLNAEWTTEAAKSASCGRSLQEPCCASTCRGVAVRFPSTQRARCRGRHPMENSDFLSGHVRT